jgi:hypothetical protein
MTVDITKMNRLKKIKFNLKFLIIFLGTIILIEAFIYLGPKNIKLNSQTQVKKASLETLQKYADEILSKCASETRHQYCYDEEIPKLMDEPASLSMEDAFALTKLVQRADPTFPYCHVLGHNLSAKEVQKNPDNWKSVLARCPSGMCSNGCIHGGFQEKFRAESFNDSQIEKIKPELQTICDKREGFNPTGLERGSCYHALGHLTMYLTSADINKSTKLCLEIALKPNEDWSQLCFDGAFMQIFQPLEPEDFALVAGKQPTKETIDDFCRDFPEREKSSCQSESWPLFREDILANPDGLVDFCSKSDPLQQSRCYNGLFYVITAQFAFDSAKIETYCNELPDTWQGQCFANAASRMIETDYDYLTRAISLCQDAEKTSVKDKCFNELVTYSTYNFHKGSDQALKVCQNVPKPWQDECFNRNKI